MCLRGLGLCLVVLAAITSACGTSSLNTSVAAPSNALDDGLIESTTTTVAVTTTTSTQTTTTTTTPLALPMPMQFDDEGVPVNGQTRGVLVTSDGWVVPVLGRIPTGWRVWTPCGREADVTEGVFVDQVDVVIDPGHGGPTEPGAVGPNGLGEADLNLEISEKILVGLDLAGYTAVVTRTADRRLPIVTRAEIALALQPTANVSIHHNGGVVASRSTPGTEMFYQGASDRSRRLAGLIYEETLSVLTQFDADWVGADDAGVLFRPNLEGTDYYGVLRRPAGVPTVLAEFAYLSNPSEALLLESTEVKNQLAGAVVKAVDRFVTTFDPGSGFIAEPAFRGYDPTGAGRTDDCTDPVLP